MKNAVGRDIPDYLLVNGKEVYQGKGYMDDDSREMVDYIFSHLRYDVGCVYGFDGLTGLLGTLATSKSSEVQSEFEKIHDKVQTAIEKVVADYASNT